MTGAALRGLWGLALLLAGAGAGKAETPPPDPPQSRLRFDFEAPPERGGGRVVGSAGSLETDREGRIELGGGVEIRFRDLRLQAERLLLDRKLWILEAEGDVVFDQGPNRLSAERAEVDLATGLGTFWKAYAYVDPDYHFRGDVIARIGEDRYEVENGEFTACTGDLVPDWSFALGRARVDVGEYARIRNVRFRLKRLPIFYWPYLIWPVKTERASGLLIPDIGYSRRRGAYLGLTHYQVLGPSYDHTLGLDLWAEGPLALGSQLRYHPSEATRGETFAYALHDPDTRDTEWRFRWHHETADLPFGLRGVVAIDHFSDLDFFRALERREEDNTRRFLYSSAFLAGSWGPHQASLLLDRRETFLGVGLTTTQEQLPRFDYQMRKLRLGRTPLYLAAESSLTYLSSDLPGGDRVRYERADLKPELTLPLRPAPWLSVALSAGGRLTRWGASRPEVGLDPATGAPTARCGDRSVPFGTAFCSEGLTRVFPTVGAQLVGPSFSRLFDGRGTFSRFKHVVEPRFQYDFVGDFGEQNRVIRFDRIDDFSPLQVVSYGLVNRVLGKPKEGGAAFEIFSFELAQAVSLDREQPLQRSSLGSASSRESAIFASLRFQPSRSLSLQSQVAYSTLFGGLESTSLLATTDFGPVDLNLSWSTRYDPERSIRPSDQLRLGFGLDLVPQRLTVGGLVSYDLVARQVQQQRYVVSYNSSCWNVVLELREQITSLYRSRDFRFGLVLRNVGSLIDYRGGDTRSLL